MINLTGRIVVDPARQEIGCGCSTRDDGKLCIVCALIMTVKAQKRQIVDPKHQRCPEAYVTTLNWVACPKCPGAGCLNCCSTGVIFVKQHVPFVSHELA